MNRRGDQPESSVGARFPAPRLRKLARPLVESAKLGFKDFRKDKERIETLVFGAINDGSLPEEEGKAIWLDFGDAITLPLVERYLAQAEFELVANFLRHRIAYHPTDWLTERNRLALDGMIAGGEAALAISLLRTFLKKLRQHTQKQWRAAGRKIDPKITDANARSAMEQARAAALLGLPAHLEIAELEMAEIESWLVDHGSREDNRALAAFRTEIAKVRERFNLA